MKTRSELLARVLELEQERETYLNYCRELEARLRKLELTVDKVCVNGVQYRVDAVATKPIRP